MGAVSCLYMHALTEMHLHQIKDKKKNTQQGQSTRSLFDVKYVRIQRALANAVRKCGLEFLQAKMDSFRERPRFSLPQVNASVSVTKRTLSHITTTFDRVYMLLLQVLALRKRVKMFIYNSKVSSTRACSFVLWTSNLVYPQLYHQTVTSFQNSIGASKILMQYQCQHYGTPKYT